MSRTVIAWLYLSGAIASEVTATTFLGKSEQFTRLMPTLCLALAYGASFYCLS
jgi:small multidrug resistance pump